MQYALIITQIDSYLTEQGGQTFRLNLEDHLGRKVALFGLPDQQVNIQSVKNQALPIVILSDSMEQQSDMQLMIPGSALVSVVPLPAEAVRSVLDAGRADEILQSLSLQTC